MWDVKTAMLLATSRSNKDLLQDRIQIYDATNKARGTVVAEMTREKATLGVWKWDVTVNDPDHPAGNPAFLLLMSGQLSFRDSGGTDLCNQYILYSIFGICIGALMVVCTLSYLVYLCLKQGRASGRAQQ